ncbi:TPA: hypothetical protein M4185_005556 [Klebsiella variicola]|nr:hypothetical protein [Escherichia coli]HCC2598102.1 hypothetical protein [Klebsiella variicola]HCI7550403.1 hypothetical protein [Klebsiella pneumoniae]HDK6365903.1 hypothetical protein [Klebsiella variicola]HDY7239248.1 hypothetical protein [Klebsiella pneumoniae]
MEFSVHKIIDSRVVLGVIPKADGCEVILKENDKGSAINELKITGVPDNSLAFTLDFNEVKPKKGKPSRLFKQLSSYVSSSNGDGVNKSCDLVIITPEEKDDGFDLKIIVLDLKSENAGPRGEKQVENSVLFINYLLSLAKYHYKEKHYDIVYFKRLITTSPVKNAIGRKGRDQSLTHKVCVSVNNHKSNIDYCRLVV